ncbi:hypothetical protein G436_4690 [Leptospira interrogans serovar Hardjo str. Norma]|uniref:Uncharacterized protein n=1 Tax=Leptospira interrogans serovar Hardjo str. Norma TaxID=1279460 RepID=A0A0M4NCP2_LEPIR|nr:hypothetical protein G436_4690 [Leptospira interrogans serovar Hardjo str. Norma]
MRNIYVSFFEGQAGFLKLFLRILQLNSKTSNDLILDRIQWGFNSKK